MPATPLSLTVQYGIQVPELPRWRLRRWVAAAVRDAAAAPPYPFQAVDLTLRLVDAEEARGLNHEFRHRDYATNVLTFEYGTDARGTAHGDIILCAPVLRREAAAQRKPLLAHAAHLTIHGVLHALGHDHIDAAEARAMEGLETRILARMGIANPYAD
ncbi:MAG: rRNA maturation RNase YbeY [Candidimonas sp.]|nr:MAG: rRNA maturation RNase YbeY [Candidimonas sp.]